MKVRKFDQYHRYLSSVSLRLQMAYPNTLILWFKRQMDLELMFSSVISLCTTNWNEWTKFFTGLLALVLVYTVSILTVTSLTFFQWLERNTFTFLSLCISHVLMEKIFHFQLRHHTCLIKLTSLQLHHRTSLIKLKNITSLQHNYNTCSKLTLHNSNILFISRLLNQLGLNSTMYIYQTPQLKITHSTLL